MAIPTHQQKVKQNIITDKQALEHVDRINRKIKAKNTWIIILLILFLSSTSVLVLNHLAILNF